MDLQAPRRREGLLRQPASEYNRPESEGPIIRPRYGSDRATRRVVSAAHSRSWDSTAYMPRKWDTDRIPAPAAHRKKQREGWSIPGHSFHTLSVGESQCTCAG